MRMVRKGSNRSEFELVVTAMLDINFLLIMFFMMTAQFQRETSAQLNLPQEQGEKEPMPDESGLVINLQAGGTIVVSSKTIDFNELQTLVRREVDQLGTADPKSLKIMIRADRDAHTLDLNRIVKMLHDQSVGTIRIATETPI